MIDGLWFRSLVGRKCNRTTGSTSRTVTVYFQQRFMRESRFWTPSRAVNSPASLVLTHTKKRSVGKAIQCISCFKAKYYTVFFEKERGIFLFDIFPVSVIRRCINHAGILASFPSRKTRVCKAPCRLKATLTGIQQGHKDETV